MNRFESRAELAAQLREQVGSFVNVDETASRIVLSGSVDSASTRAIAEAIALQLSGGKTVENEILIDAALLEGAQGELSPEYVDEAAEPLNNEQVDAEDVEQFAPTDPVVTIGARGDVEVLGGFSETSLSSVEVAPSAEDQLPGDEALADAVRRELREDASTTDLQVRVTVVDGVVTLRGRVATLDDADNAESVASSVPGIRDVEEQLEVAGF